MILSRKFTLAEDDDYEHIAAAGGRLRALLEAFSEGSLPPEYGPEQLAEYALSLLEAQRDDGSFSSCMYPEKLDADVRTDALRFVTWAALAFLCRFQDETAEQPNRFSVSVPGLEAGIRAAMDSPEIGNFLFPESGEAEPVQQVEAVLILSSGGIPGRLQDHPSTAPEMKAGLDALKTDFRKRLETGNTTLPGAIEYSDLFRQALAALDVPGREVPEN